MRKLFFKSLLLAVLPLISSCTPRIYSKVEGVTLGANEGVFQYSNELIPILTNEESYSLSGTITNVSKLVQRNMKIIVNFYSSMDLEDDDHYAQEILSTSYTFRSKTVFNYSFDIPEFSSHINNGIMVRIGLFKDVKYFSNVDFYITCNDKSEVIIQDNRNKDYELSKQYRQNGEVERCIINFDSFPDTLFLSEYYHLDITKFSFSYDSNVDLELGSVKLLFLDKNNLFPRLSKQSGNTVIPLQYVKKSNRYYLKYKPMFVDRDTLTMYKNKISTNLYSTNYLYFPRYSKDLVKDYVFTIVGTNFGRNNRHYNFNFSLDLSRLLIGPCDSSAYCIIGGKK